MENGITPYLGRYEGEAINGMTMFVTFRPVEYDNDLYTYEYGVKGFPPKEVIQISGQEVLERVSNCVSNGYSRVYDLATLPDESADNPANKIMGKSFSFTDWVEKHE